MTARSFQQVDVFSPEALRGNPLAVLLDSQGLSTEAMQLYAQWTNLSETSFLEPATNPAADVKVRIFTVSTELSFAGHPILGAVHAWLKAGNVPKATGKVKVECQRGLIDVRINSQESDVTNLAFRAPELLRTGPLEDDVLEWAIGALGIQPEAVVAHQWIANGPQWAGLMLRSAEDVLAIEPDYKDLEGLEVGVIGPHLPATEADALTKRKAHAKPRKKGARAELEPLEAAPDELVFDSEIATAPADFEVRAFVSGEGQPEDPATGSLNAGFGVWLTYAGLASSKFVVRQGTRIGRAGMIGISAEDDGVWVAGDCRTLIQGSVTV
ncbi:PhzF family phenazine biosynthesis protein [Neomicrococcus aestuarii]|uniref:Phenazine biosynthesis protein PhzC/PhzF n=1 Tax=Neomicrococcus aestuarii TaxID=556325 RepID=A0A1L2ZPE6_9MICC|nr:PhzF family phenazine biosynthesis protein [Neomicrococcus aestuarii]APF41295.1 phenazine biosynthesis protein PhzC/PhzF [Neomicrococcus aestuarii]MBB5513207.1 PhzF family phenazine biosynthesis protein [Neomicrococcus aestuarii]